MPSAAKPYFVTDQGADWTPIGAKDAITWPELAGLYRRRDLPGVRRHVAALRRSGVTVVVFQRPHHLLSRAAAEARVFYFEEPLYADIAEPQLETRTTLSAVTVAVPMLPHALAESGSNSALRQLVRQLMLLAAHPRPSLHGRIVGACDRVRLHG